MIFKINSGKYGFQLHIELFKVNFIIRLFQRFDTETTIGIRNNTPDGKRLFFGDYENILYEEHLIPELLFLQKKYELSDIYIFKSSQKIGNYHIICLDKLLPRTWCELIEETNCDPNYKKVPIMVDNKAWVLRFMPKRKSHKPELIKILHSKFQNREKSLAHANFLRLNYGIDTKSLKNLDNNTDVTITIYETLNYIR